MIWQTIDGFHQVVATISQTNRVYDPQLSILFSSTVD
jgi:hypothetical protein